MVTPRRVKGWTADDVDISYTFVNNPAGDNGLTNFRGAAVIESVTVSTTFTVPSLGFFGILRPSPPTLNGIASGARHRFWMKIATMVLRFSRDINGSVLVEVSVMLPIIIFFVLGSIDFLFAFYEWNAATKAVQVGARIAAVSNPVVTNLNGLSAALVSEHYAPGARCRRSP